MGNSGHAPPLGPWRGTLLYLVLGAIAVVVGDWLLASVVTDAAQLQRLQRWKGWAYVILTSGFTWWFLRRLRSAESVRTVTAHELSQIARYAPAGIARAQLDGQFLWANQRLCNILGGTLDQVMHLNFRTVVAAHDREWATRQLQSLIAGEIDHYVDERLCERLDNGAQVPVLCTVTLAPQVGSEPAHLLCVLQDLQEITAARADLRNVETRQRLASTVVDNTIEGVIVTDAQSRILSVNAAFTRLLGYTEEELLGKNPGVLKSGRHDKAFYEAMWTAIAKTGHWQGEIWNRRKNGEVFPEHMSLSAVRDPLGDVTHYVCVFSDISQDKEHQAQLEYLSHNDPITGLPNRTWFAQQLQGLVQTATASGEYLAVLLLNLDRFKDVNESYGHTTGDEVLRHITRRMRLSLRPGDLLGRLAGDEFVVVVRRLRHADGAAAVARNLIRAVAEPWHSPDDIEVVAGVSVGIAMYPEHASTAETLLQCAHAAVYGAKALGRGSLCFYNE
ncbi:MAG: diguanylate cyclase, partial [Burkholderiaceae bacterium]|nr:diguanylate cyclase [Burkholderiaceae bacterium]